MSRSRGYTGAVAVITGGGSGIGKAIGAGLAARGAHVVLADVDAAAAESAAEAILRSGGVAAGRQLDVRDGDAFRELVDDVVATDGRIDFLFNNAGVQMGGPTHELTAEHWDRIIDVNLRGVVNGLLAAYPRMVAQGHGHIVNTASGAGLLAPPFVTAYAATKFAVVGLSTGLRPEAALHGVRVSVLCPGAVDTPILDAPPGAGLPETPSAPVTAREYLDVIGQRPVSADTAARYALGRIARDTPIIVVPAAARVPWYLARLSPALAQRAMAPIARKVQRRLIRAAG